jgi:hypothetical protein
LRARVYAQTIHETVVDPFLPNTDFNSFLTRAIAVKFELSHYTGSLTKHSEI